MRHGKRTVSITMRNAPLAPRCRAMCRRRARATKLQASEAGYAKASRLNACASSGLPPPSPRQAERRGKKQRMCAARNKRTPRQRSYRRGRNAAAMLGEARASHNGVLVVAVAVHLDPVGREAAPTTCAVSRQVRKDDVNARPYRA